MAFDFFDQVDDSPLSEEVKQPKKGGGFLTMYAVSPPQRDIEHVKQVATKRNKDMDDGEWDPDNAALLIVACMHVEPNSESKLCFSEKDLARLANLPTNLIEPMANACERVCKRDYASRKVAKKNSEETTAPKT